jgi:hypothetical protein
LKHQIRRDKNFTFRHCSPPRSSRSYELEKLVRPPHA